MTGRTDASADPRPVLVTGGAGFIGSNLADRLASDGHRVIVYDALSRPGVERNLSWLQSRHGDRIEHVQADIRDAARMTAAAQQAKVVFHLAAQVAVTTSMVEPVEDMTINLVGTVNCLEAVRRCGAALVFLSTSRVYPIAGLRGLPLRMVDKRLEPVEGAAGPGWSAAGITTAFPMAGSRSIYGATKLASELLIEEYGAMYGTRAVVNRCGVLTGPWQMGKVDQGFVVLWAARHLFGGSLAYMGFGGTGVQVRDILHVADLYDLVRLQVDRIGEHAGRTYNVGGGAGVSVSLAELTDLCVRRCQRVVEIGRDPETRAADIPYYVTDNAEVTAASGWKPTRGVETIVGDIFAWLEAHGAEVQPILR